MARKLYIDTAARDPRTALVTGYGNTTPLGQKPLFIVGDNNPTEIYLVDSQSGGGYHSDSGSGSVTVKLGIVTPGARPTGGTYKLEHSTNASAAIDYNASAATIDTALNAIASVTAAGGVTVTGSFPVYTITWDSNGAQSDFTQNDNSLTPDGQISVSKLIDGDGSTQEVVQLKLSRSAHALQTSWSTITNGWSADFAMIDSKLETLLNGSSSVDTTLELQITDGSGKVRTYLQTSCLLLAEGIVDGIFADLTPSSYYTSTECDNLFPLIAQNLADLASASTARTNLGISAVNTPFTPTTAGDWTGPPTEVGGALDELANRTNGISATKTESAEVSVSTAGDTNLDPADDQAVSSFFVAAAAGAGSYTRNLLLKQPTPGEPAQVALIRLNLAASGNPTLKIYDDTTGGTLLHTAVGNAKRAREEFAVCVWNNTSTQWELMNEPDASGIGLQTAWIPATAMTARSTNGAATGSTETTTNKVMLETLDFDQSTNEYAQFSIAMPDSWDLGTVWAQFHWTAASGTGTVTWGLQGVSIVNDGALDVAFGTAQTATDTLLLAQDDHLSPETSAITISSAAADAITYFQVYRDTSDTLNADAQLIGVKLLYTTTAGHDD